MVAVAAHEFEPLMCQLPEQAFYFEEDGLISSPHILIEASIDSSNSELNNTGSYEERRKALLRIHNVENEVNKVRKMRENGLSEAEMQQYTHDQVTNQVAEHAIGVPYNTLSIVAKADGSFTMYGMDILQMYKETAEMTSEGSQQWSEYRAYKNLYDRISEGANVAIEVSPTYTPSLHNPNPAQRSFAFLHTVGEYNQQLDGVVIKEHLLRWEDVPGDLSKSIEVQQGIQRSAGLTPTPRGWIGGRTDIVESPTAFVSENPQNIDNTLSVVGLSPEDIHFSHQAKAMLEEGGADLLKKYHDIIEKLSQIHNKHSINYLTNKRRAEALIENVFILGSKIRKWLRGESNEHPYSHLDIFSGFGGKNKLKYFESMYKLNRQNNEDLTVLGGSDCTTVTNDVFSGLLSKTPVEGVTHRSGGKVHESNKNCASCGVCGKIEPVRVIDGAYYCEDCKMNGPEVDAKAA